MGSAAIESLHRLYPGKYVTGVSGTAVDDLYAYNPRVSFPKRSESQFIEMQYPLINSSGSRPLHFMEAYCDFLGKRLGVDLPCMVAHPMLYLSAQEKGWLSQVAETGWHGPYWLVNAGSKREDFPIKQYARYQEVIDATPQIKWVQVGEAHHNHKPLKGVINLVGKTTTRQLIRLVYHAAGALTGVSFLHHIAAAFEKPCVTVSSGLESKVWEAYDSGTFLFKAHCLPCGNKGRGCWKSHPLPTPGKAHCLLPVLDNGLTVGKCMQLIEPSEVVRAILDYGTLS